MRSINNKLLAILPLAVLVFLLSSCWEDREVFTPRSPTGDHEIFFDNFTNDHETFVADASSDILIETTAGTAMRIPFGGLSIPGGAPVIEGNVSISILEIRTKGDMIKYRTPTATSTQRLISGGEFYIEVTKDDQELSITEGKSFKLFVMDNDPIDRMEVFFGGLTDEMTVVWDENPQDRPNNIEVGEWFMQNDSTSIEGFGYILNCDTFTWINIDVFDNIPDEDKTLVCARLPEEVYTEENTVVYLVFKDELSVLTMPYVEEEMKFCTAKDWIPIGYEVYIISITAIDEDEYHFGMKMISVVEDLTVDINPEPKSLQEVKTILDGLM